MYITRYKVRGTGAFPYDMLRYDASYPVLDTSGLDCWYAQHGNEQRVVTLEHADSQRSWTPSIERWLTYSWAVSVNTLEEVKIA